MANVKSVIEGKRGCGYRKPGGIYFRSDTPGEPCGKLPLELHNCPVCNEGIKFSRNYKWINPSILFRDQECRFLREKKEGCRAWCKLNDQNITDLTKSLLIWIGDKHYSVSSFSQEAVEMGISRKIKSVPRGFVIGESWIMLAHTKCFSTVIADEEINKAGIFMAWKPERIEYVVRGDESEDELNALELKGFSLVKITRKIEGDQEIFDDSYEVVDDE